MREKSQKYKLLNNITNTFIDERYRQLFLYFKNYIC